MLRWRIACGKVWVCKQTKKRRKLLQTRTKKRSGVQDYLAVDKLSNYKILFISIMLKCLACVVNKKKWTSSVADNYDDELNWSIVLVFNLLCFDPWNLMSNEKTDENQVWFWYVIQNTCGFHLCFHWVSKLMHVIRVVKSIQLPAKIAAYLVSIGRLLWLAFLYVWHFLNKIFLNWPLTLTSQPSISNLCDNPAWWI